MPDYLTPFFYIPAKLQQGFPLPNPYNISFVNSDIEVLEVRFLISFSLLIFTVEQASSFVYYLFFKDTFILFHVCVHECVCV